MPLYEHVLIARQDISPQQVDTLADGLAQIIEDGGGKIEKREYWGLRTLAYRVNKNRKGHYCLFNIDASHDAVAEMERQMRINEDVLRYMTIRVDELDPEESAIMRSRNRGDDRRPRGDRPDDRRRRDDDRPRDRRDDEKPKETPAAAEEAKPETEGAAE